MSSALIGCFTVPLISKKVTQRGKYIFKFFLSQLYHRVIIMYIKRGHQGAVINQIKSLSLSHHHSTCALVSEILECAPDSAETIYI